MLAVFGSCFLSLLLSLSLLWRWKKNKRQWDLLATIPGPRPLPFVGNAKELGMFNSAYKHLNPLSTFLLSLEALSVLYRKEKMFSLWLGPHPTVFLFGPETFEPILKSSILVEKGDIYDIVKDIFGEGLISSEGKKWRPHRKMLTPAFNANLLESFLPIMNEQAVIFSQKVKEAMQIRKWIDVHEYCKLFTFDVICEAALGVQVGAQKDSETTFVKAFTDFFKVTVMRMTNPILLNNTLFSLTKHFKEYTRALTISLEFTQSIVDAKILRKEETAVGTVLTEKEKKKLSFSDILLEHYGTEFDRIAIRDHINTLVVAAFDTTGSTLGWVLYLLGTYEEVQGRVLEEMEQVFGREFAGDVTQEDLKRLKYTECVIKESLRLFSSAPFISRKLVEDTLIGGHVIPKETEVYLALYLLHHDPDVFPNPELFDPDRFSPENSIGRHPYAFVPFSSGPRNCIGQRYALMTIKVLLCHVLCRFHISSLDVRDKVIIYTPGVLKSARPLRVHFQPR